MTRGGRIRVAGRNATAAPEPDIAYLLSTVVII